MTQSSNTNKLYSKRCNECGLIHFSTINCKQLPCIYCNSLHNIKDYIDGECPQVYRKSYDLREKNMIACPKCKGLGVYKKDQRISIMELDSEYKQRIQFWRKYVKKNDADPEPQKMVFDNAPSESIVACANCDKEGLVKPIKFCCFSGCAECSYTGAKINVVYTRLKKQQKKIPVKVTKETRCIICTNDVKTNEYVFALECRHIFHNRCLGQHFRKQPKQQKKCPQCRQIQKYFPFEGDELQNGIFLKNIRNTSINHQTVLTKYRSRSRDNNRKTTVQMDRNIQEKHKVRYVYQEYSRGRGRGRLDFSTYNRRNYQKSKSNSPISSTPDKKKVHKRVNRSPSSASSSIARHNRHK